MTTEPATAPSPSGTATDVRIGILCMLAAMLAFTVMDSLSKHLVRTQDPLQVVWGIYVVQAVVLCTVMARRLPRLLPSRQVGLQALRAALLVAKIGRAHV